MLQATDSSLLFFFMLMRLMQLMRISRIVRLLRFVFFKELLLMIQGISAGFRKLFWAIVFLLFVIFALGMLMRQTLGKWCLEEDPYCNNEHLIMNSEILFSFVPRSCFTIFRCLTEGCSSVDGTPLLIHIYDNGYFGAGMVILYMLVYLWVTFGLLRTRWSPRSRTSASASERGERPHPRRPEVAEGGPALHAGRHELEVWESAADDRKIAQKEAVLFLGRAVGGRWPRRRGPGLQRGDHAHHVRRHRAGPVDGSVARGLGGQRLRPNGPLRHTRRRRQQLDRRRRGGHRLHEAPQDRGQERHRCATSDRARHAAKPAQLRVSLAARTGRASTARPRRRPRTSRRTGASRGGAPAATRSP